MKATGEVKGERAGGGQLDMVPNVQGDSHRVLAGFRRERAGSNLLAGVPKRPATREVTKQMPGRPVSLP